MGYYNSQQTFFVQLVRERFFKYWSYKLNITKRNPVEQRHKEGSIRNSTHIVFLAHSLPTLDFSSLPTRVKKQRNGRESRYFCFYKGRTRLTSQALLYSPFSKNTRAWSSKERGNWDRNGFMLLRMFSASDERKWDKCSCTTASCRIHSASSSVIIGFLFFYLYGLAQTPKITIEESIRYKISTQRSRLYELISGDVIFSFDAAAAAAALRVILFGVISRSSLS